MGLSLLPTDREELEVHVVGGASLDANGVWSGLVWFGLGWVVFDGSVAAAYRP
jgi:hypothetical protein